MLENLYFISYVHIIRENSKKILKLYYFGNYKKKSVF